MTKSELQNHVQWQLKNFFCCDIDVSKYLDLAIAKTNYCLSDSNCKYMPENIGGGGIAFSVFHSGQYCVFLYYLSCVMFDMDGDGHNAEKVYYLNKALNAVDLFYEISLPDVWFVEHPLGAVMGRAKYSDYFFFFQGCTVGSNHRIYPTIGEHVMMMSNSKILGDAHIGDHVIIAANTYIKADTIPSCSVVFGESPNLVIKHKTVEEIANMLDGYVPFKK